jgi:hypothetical protein
MGDVYSDSVFLARLSLVLVWIWCLTFHPRMADGMSYILVCVILMIVIQPSHLTSAHLRILALATWTNNYMYVVEVKFISTSLIRLNGLVLRSRNGCTIIVSVSMFVINSTSRHVCLRFCPRNHPPLLQPVTKFLSYNNTALVVCVCVCVCVRERDTNSLFNDALNCQDYAPLAVVEWNMCIWWNDDTVKRKYWEKCLSRCHSLRRLAWDRTVPSQCEVNN